MKLEDIRFRTECRVPWESMKGDDVVRHCVECGRDVYNLSNLDREAAERLVGQREFPDCVTLFRRPDGTVVTRDCTPLAERFPELRTTGVMLPPQGPPSEPETCPRCEVIIMSCRPCRGRGYRWVPGNAGQAVDCPDCGGRGKYCACKP